MSSLPEIDDLETNTAEHIPTNRASSWGEKACSPDQTALNGIRVSSSDSSEARADTTSNATDMSSNSTDDNSEDEDDGEDDAISEDESKDGQAPWATKGPPSRPSAAAVQEKKEKPKTEKPKKPTV